MSNLTNFARAELQRAGLFGKGSAYDGMLGDAVMRLIEVFSAEGHSGMSASMAVQLFEKLARFEPIEPLTGDPDEWNEVGPGLLQNRRCSRVFKENGEAYDVQGKVFREPGGACFLNGDSRRPVTFPYMPRTEYVDVPSPDAPGEEAAARRDRHA